MYITNLAAYFTYAYYDSKWAYGTILFLVTSGCQSVNRVSPSDSKIQQQFGWMAQLSHNQMLQQVRKKKQYQTLNLVPRPLLDYILQLRKKTDFSPQL